MASSHFNGCLTTVSGGWINPLDPCAEDLLLTDIAHALAAMPRFGGHTREHYSVAQHAVWMSEHLPPDLAIYGLLRSAPSAFLMEMIGPCKREMPEYCAAEAKLSYVAHQAFNLNPFLAGSRLTAAVDDLALLVEWRDQKDARLEYWGIDPTRIGGLSTEPAWGFEVAKERFLRRFVELMSAPAGKIQVPGYAAAVEAMEAMDGWRPPLRREIVTASGAIVDPRRPFAVPLADLAKSLSRVPRFAGHTRVPYSVAQHSLWVMEQVPDEFKLHALLHDAAEWLYSDMPSPVKRRMPGYSQQEGAAQRQMLAANGLDATVAKPGPVKYADELACLAEIRDLMPGVLSRTVDLGAVAHLPPIQPAPAAEVESAFMLAFVQAANLRPSAPAAGMGMAC